MARADERVFWRGGGPLHAGANPKTQIPNPNADKGHPNPNAGKRQRTRRNITASIQKKPKPFDLGLGLGFRTWNFELGFWALGFAI
jgi:hypothetical protein